MYSGLLSKLRIKVLQQSCAFDNTDPESSSAANKAKGLLNLFSPNTFRNFRVFSFPTIVLWVIPSLPAVSYLKAKELTERYHQSSFIRISFSRTINILKETILLQYLITGDSL